MTFELCKGIIQLHLFHNFTFSLIGCCQVNNKKFNGVAAPIPILIIDDEPSQLKTLADIFEEEGLLPICCENEESAVQTLKERNINIAILDLNLGKTDGIVLLKKLRKINPEIKIIINTGYATLESAMTAVNEEAFAYVKKMDNVENLLNHVQRAINEHLVKYNESLKNEVEKQTLAIKKANEKLLNDITMRQEIEQKLRESEEKFSKAFMASPFGIVISRLSDDIILEINEVGVKMTGYTYEEVIGKSLVKLNFIDNVQYKEFLSLLQYKSFYKENEVKYFSSGKSEKVGLFSGTIIKINSVDCQIIVIQDITDKKNAEKERLVMEEQLRQLEKMQAIGQLAGGVAHDFNNQLTGIMSCADLIKNGLNKNDTLYEYADMISSAAKRSAKLTNQLLAFARKGKYRTVAINVHTLINEVISLLERSINKKITIRQHLLADPSVTMGDPVQLHNAFLNIALNSRDAMPDGGEILFNTDNVELNETECKFLLPFEIQPGHFLIISVIDNGIGIDKEIQKHIFEPFYTSKKGKGTGMGLAAVYGTMKSHKGAIEVSSVKNEGTTFKIYLPLCSDQVPKSKNKPVSKEKKMKARILVIDDEDNICKTISIILTNKGLDVTTFVNGKKAIEFYRKEWKNTDLVILDLIMPVMDGFEVSNEILKANPDAKILFSSGYSIDHKIQQLLEKETCRFIQKPYHIDDLFSIITSMLK